MKQNFNIDINREDLVKNLEENQCFRKMCSISQCLLTPPVDLPKKTLSTGWMNGFLTILVTVAVRN